jgi:hypothetical protein
MNAQGPRSPFMDSFRLADKPGVGQLRKEWEPLVEVYQLMQSPVRSNQLKGIYSGHYEWKGPVS